MIPVDQTTTGPAGNCLAACVASLLELPVEDVPNFMDGLPPWQEGDPQAQARWFAAFLDGINAWLTPRGLWYFEAWAEGGLDAALVEMLGRAGYWIAIGEPVAVGEPGALHAVVMSGPDIVHDPGPARSGLRRIRAAGLLVGIDPARAAAP